jgi:hypothetical protein
MQDGSVEKINFANSANLFRELQNATGRVMLLFVDCVGVGECAFGLVQSYVPQGPRRITLTVGSHGSGREEKKVIVHEHSIPRAGARPA